jgi:hypothetical protein
LGKYFTGRCLAITLAAVLAVFCPARPAAAEEQAVISLWVVHATEENREKPFFGRGLEAIRDVMEGLPGDTFRRVLNQRNVIPLHKEIRIRMDSRYTLFLKPVSREENGRIRIDLRVELDPKKPDGKPVRLLGTRLALAPGKKVKLQGFKKEAGELIVVMVAQQE